MCWAGQGNREERTALGGKEGSIMAFDNASSLINIS